MEAFADIKKTLAEGFRVENKGDGISHALLKILQQDKTIWEHFTKLRWDSKRALFELVKAVGDNPDSKLTWRTRTDYMIWEEKFNLVSNVWMEDTLYVSEEVTEEILAKYFTAEKAAIKQDTQAEIATVVAKSEVKVEESEKVKIGAPVQAKVEKQELSLRDKVAKLAEGKDMIVFLKNQLHEDPAGEYIFSGSESRYTLKFDLWEMESHVDTIESYLEQEHRFEK